MTQAHYLRQFRRYHNNRATLRRKRNKQLVYLRFGAYINTPSRLVEYQNFAVTQQPLRDNHLLLIAARQQTHLLTRRRSADAQQIYVLIAGRLHATLVQHASYPRVTGKTRESHVRTDVHRRRQTEPLAVLRQVANASLNRIVRTVDATYVAVHYDVARITRVRAEYRTRNLRASRTHQTREPQNLAALNRKTYVANLTTTAQIANL